MLWLQSPVFRHYKKVPWDFSLGTAPLTFHCSWQDFPGLPFSCAQTPHMRLSLCVRLYSLCFFTDILYHRICCAHILLKPRLGYCHTKLRTWDITPQLSHRDQVPFWRTFIVDSVLVTTHNLTPNARRGWVNRTTAIHTYLTLSKKKNKMNTWLIHNI